MESIADELLGDALRSSYDRFVSSLGAFTLIDVGSIDFVDGEGRAQITSCRFTQGEHLIYRNVEVVYPGNARGAYKTLASGSACLIFIPYTCMPNVGNKEFRPGAAPYCRDGIKAMPISNGQDLSVNTLFDDAGEFGINSENWSLLFGDQVIELTQDSVLSVSKGIGGELYLSYNPKNGSKLRVSITEDGIIKNYESSDGSSKWSSVLSEDGTLTLIHLDSNDEEINKVEIASDGTLNLFTKNDIEAEVEGDISIKAKQDVNVDVDGKVVVDNATGIEFMGNTRTLVTYAELNQALTQFWNQLNLALTTTPIAGNGAPQPSWVGLPTSIDISQSEASKLKTGGNT